jgi:hypothetical protein
MTILEKAKTALAKHGIDSHIEPYRFNADSIGNVLIVKHNYTGYYPTDETRSTMARIEKIVRRYNVRTESRGCYTATFIFEKAMR